ncbi:MAG: endonuclease/exonuclease/phosphatase family protein [Candidatus Latescibacter sp.]|nr:endonuclease/exonuclease/phosphatase family protein [Candidatus Latescibacter sp.]
MPYYKTIDNSSLGGRRTAQRLLRLKKTLDEAIPAKTVDKTLLLASWNIREFGGDKFGEREKEPLFYLAEIMSRFDLIALQEVRDNLDALDELMNILGGWWKYLVSDVTLGRQGNQERHTFIYDTRKLSFGGLAGELFPPLTKEGDQLKSEFAFARTPYLAGFRAGWFKFSICTQHLYYGKAKPDDPQRQREAETVVELLRVRMKSKDCWANNAILVGDFNVFSTNDKTFLALEKGDFHIPANLRGKYTNAKLDKPFDQMAFLAPDIEKQINLAKAGVFPFFEYVYCDSDREIYLPDKDDKTYKEWRTYKMSDHLPIWVELEVDFGNDYLMRKTKAPEH